VDVEAEGAEDAGFGGEEGGATAFVGAFGDVVTLCFLVFELGGVEECGRKGRQVGVDVYDAAWGFWVRGEFGSEVEGGGGDLLLGSISIESRLG
jgi:hypothetical protein